MRKKVGRKKIPQTKQIMRKKASSPILPSISVPEMAAPAAAMVESMTIIMIPEISSNTRIPKVNCVKRSFKSPSSSKVLLTTAVEDMVSIAPAKRLSIGCQPSSLAQA